MTAMAPIPVITREYGSALFQHLNRVTLPAMPGQGERLHIPGQRPKAPPPATTHHRVEAACTAILRAIAAGHHDRLSISQASGVTRNLADAAFARIRARGLAIRSDVILPGVGWRGDWQLTETGRTALRLADRGQA